MTLHYLARLLVAVLGAVATVTSAAISGPALGAVVPATVVRGPASGADVPIAFGTLESVGIFVAIPVGLAILIALAVAAPRWANEGRDGRYRPGLPWDAEPVWFNGPGQDARQAAGDAQRAGESALSEDAGGAGGGW